MSIFSLEKNVEVSVFFIGSQNYELQQTVENLNQWETINFDLSLQWGNIKESYFIF